jgi:hypothetical protein
MLEILRAHRMRAISRTCFSSRIDRG